MLETKTVPIPATWIAFDDADDAERFPVGSGNSPKDAIATYFEACLLQDPSYTNDSPEFAQFLQTY